MSIAYLDVVDSKLFARRFATMLDTHLISYKHYFPWADAAVAALNSPPNWLLEVSTIKYIPEASRVVIAYAYSEPFQEFDSVELSDDHVACMFLSYQKGATSWATFLSDSGCHVDGSDGRMCCEYFFISSTVLKILNMTNRSFLNSRKGFDEITAMQLKESISFMTPLWGTSVST